MEFLKKALAYLLVLRPLNLLIICITQFVFQYYLIIPLSESVTLKGILFPLFVLCTVIIAASGYLINDIIDQETDAHNKPQKQYIGTGISEYLGYFYYLILLLTGALLSVYIAYKSNTWNYIGIYPAGIWCMYLYSRYLKSTVLAGNILISLFTAGTIGILGFAQFANDHTLSSHLKSTLIFYMIFVFLSSLIREIVKDAEDTEGDIQSGLITFPIHYGLNITKRTLISLVVLLVIILFYWIGRNSSMFPKSYIIYMVGLVIVPFAGLLYYLIPAQFPKDFSRISKLIKLIMVTGMTSIIFIS